MYIYIYTYIEEKQRAIATNYIRILGLTDE